MTDVSDAARLADELEPSALGELMASARRDVPSERQLAALADRLAPVLGSPAGIAQRLSVLSKLGVAAGVASLLVGGALLVRQAPSDSRPQPSSASPPSVSLPAAAGAAPAPTVTAAQAPPSNPPPSVALATPEPKSVPEPKPARGAPAQRAALPGEPSEASLLEQARRVLASSPAAALALTGQHAQRFPHGVLAQEREVIAIDALRRLHRSAEAEARAAAFARAFPGSAHARAVEDSSPK